MIYTQTRIRPGEWHALNPLGFWDTNALCNPGQKSRLRDYYQKKKKKKKKKKKNREAAKEWDLISRRNCKRTKKVVEYESDGDTNCNWYAWNSPQRLGKRAWRGGNWRTYKDHPNYWIVRNRQKNKGCPKVLRTFVVKGLLWKTISWCRYEELSRDVIILLFIFFINNFICYIYIYIYVY